MAWLPGVVRSECLLVTESTAGGEAGCSGERRLWTSGEVIPKTETYFATVLKLYPAPRSWAERAYPKLIHYNKLDKGGHFAAWEQPQLLSEESNDSSRTTGRSGKAAAEPGIRPLLLA